ncbi:hypothetical protein Q6Y00_003309 [Salmonella enterica]|nr:hypothetical protein [Salmonella enterica]EJF5174105.1 hypothetical protein [Salmonella enterica]EKB5319533.1 hypothetical protein [Salmonella enterica]ELK9206962.1 hypothetical protein [Salmonella enterica]ELK9220058.1 hypothetical protein [Salmonella enterica]
MKFNKKEIASTVSVGMVRVIRCHRRNMKNNIINGSEVSGLSVAIQISEKWESRRPDGEQSPNF